VQVTRETAQAYADLVLGLGRFTGEVLRETVDFDRGTFHATVPFVVDDEGHWGITADEWERTKRYGPSGHLVRIETDYLARLAKLLSPYLRAPGRILVVDEWIATAPRMPLPEHPDLWVHRRVEDRWQRFALLAGPVPDPEVLRQTVMVGPPHWQVGAVVNTHDRGVPLPARGDTVSDDDLRRLLSDVVALYMRMTSYDGHLVWLRDDAESS
jgi:hypothetical protein